MKSSICIETTKKRIINSINETNSLYMVEAPGIACPRLVLRNGTNDSDTAKEIFIKKVYFKKSLKQCLNGEQQPRVWLDLGMHIGCFAVYVSQYGCSVIGYEPNIENIALAEVNINLNPTFGIFVCHNEAVVPKAQLSDDKYVSLHISPKPNCTTRHVTIPTYPHSTQLKKYKVKATTLNKVFQLYPKIDAIKMDIEGMEVALLEEIDYIPERVRVLVFEYTFDFVPGHVRFQGIIQKLSTWFNVETSITKDIITFANTKQYPHHGYVYCIRKTNIENIYSLKTERSNCFDQAEELIMKLPLSKKKRSTKWEGIQNSYLFGWTKFLDKRKMICKPCKDNASSRDLLLVLVRLLKTYSTTFEFTTINININIETARHTDNNNFGSSVIVGLGNYTGGRFCVTGNSERNPKLQGHRELTMYNIKRNFVLFDGREEHYTEPFTNTRISITFFCMFKPNMFHKSLHDMDEDELLHL